MADKPTQMVFYCTCQMRSLCGQPFSVVGRNNKSGNTTAKVQNKSNSDATAQLIIPGKSSLFGITMGTTSRAYLRETSSGRQITEFLPSLKSPSLSLKSKRPPNGQPLFVKQTSTDGKPSRPQKSVFAHKWVIRNFSRLYEDPDGLVKSKLPVLYSRKFSESYLNDARLSLRLLPEYFANDGQRFLAISLFYEETLSSESSQPEPLSLKYEISLLDSFGQKQNRKSK